MRAEIFAGYVALMVCGPAGAAEDQTQSKSGAAEIKSPAGEWLVENQTARIKVENCGGEMWGAVSWEKSPGGQDTQNPDPTKRSRATLGLPIILHMRASQNGRWDGEVYNAENGKTYTAHMQLLNPGTLRIEGCVFGVLCGGENWTRFEAKSAAAKSTTAAARELDVCSGVSDGKSRTR
ncbi:MAG: DUF2147 domain-containing protein [Hyphomicrobiales bacterium]|nr:DUF2147 domain-containing protein [Hyphomicrobiales bacterium]